MPSSIIELIVYEESRSELTVTFATGKTYVYGLVPKRIYDDFRDAGSKGNYFNAHIRDRYPTRRTTSAAATSPSQDWNAALENLRKK